MLFALYLIIVCSFGYAVEINETSAHQDNSEGAEQCSTCEFREHSRLMRLHSIKSQILSALRLEQAPNISRDMIRKAPPLDATLGPVRPSRGGRRHHATTETIIVMSTKSNPVGQDDLSSCCSFSLSPRIQLQNIISAQLWVHLRPADTATSVFLQISHHPKPTEEGNSTRIRSSRVDIEAGASSWKSVDVKSLLQAWLRQPETNYGMEITALDSEGVDLAVTSSEPGEEGLQPFIEVKILDSPRRSRRDSGLNCDEGSTETGCCRYPLTIDFEWFGWDWIIYPKSYTANYCAGECRHIGTAANDSCKPTKMSPLTMFYYNHKYEIILANVSSMVVDQCGCS